MVPGFFCLKEVMSTSVKLLKSYDMQYCGECVHCIHDPNISYCRLGKWKYNDMNEVFFYNPNILMNERSIVDNMGEDIWTHSLLCKDFIGDAYQVVEMICRARTDGYTEYEIKTIPKFSSKYNRDVHFFVNIERDSAILKWLSRIEIY